jgi:sugar phosphate isomerase/epimerase
MSMQIALNGSTLGPCGLDEELTAAAQAGFGLVELRAPKLEGVTDLKRRLVERGLRALSINSLEGAGERDLREPARRQAAWAAECGAPYVVCVPGRRREGIEDAVASLAEICRAEGAELAFEFMGFEWSAVRTLPAALAVHPGPVVIDTFHWSLGGSSLADLSACDPDRIAIVHVNDAPSVDLASLADEDRVLPGEGVLRLDGFYRALLETGWDGVLSVELFSPVPAERAHAAMTRLARSLVRGGVADA